MGELFISLPKEFTEIRELLIQKEWIITAFPKEIDIYNPAEYLHTQLKDGIKHVLVLDRNLFSFIISSVKKGDNSKQIYREAIALVIFCQAAEILIEPSLSLYERLNYNHANLDIVMNELQIFRNIDNTNSEVLMDYFFEKTNKLVTTFNSPLEENIRTDLIKYEWLIEWRSLYLMLLKLIDLNKQTISNEKKLEELYRWMMDEFKRSAVVVIYAVFLFSTNRMRKMIKYKENDSIEEKVRNVKNMTWDLYFMNKFMRLWTDKTEGHIEYIFASDDKVIKEILKATIEVQVNSNMTPLEKYLTAKEYSYLNNLLNKFNLMEPRKKSNLWTVENREKLIKEYEQKLIYT